MMNANEYVAFLKRSVVPDWGNRSAVDESMKVWTRLRREQLGNWPSFNDIVGEESEISDWTSEVFNQFIVQPLIGVLPPSVQSKVANVPVAIIPMLALNGHAVKAPNGEPVIVINHSLLTIINLYIETVISIPLISNSFGEELALSYQIEHYRFILSYFLHPYVAPFPQDLIKMPKEKFEIIMVITLAIETFVVAHELAHIYANHLNDTKLRRLSINTDGSIPAEFYQISQHKEFEADTIAWRWYQQWFKSIINQERFLLGLTAPLSFFSLLSLVEKNVQVSDAYSTHPSSEARLINLIRTFPEETDPKIVEFAHIQLLIARNSPVLDK